MASGCLDSEGSCRRCLAGFGLRSQRTAASPLLQPHRRRQQQLDRRRRRRLSTSVDVDLRRIPSTGTTIPPPQLPPNRTPPPSPAAAGAVWKSSWVMQRRQPIVTPICRGRASPQSALREPAAPEEVVCTRSGPRLRAADGGTAAGTALLNANPPLSRPALRDQSRD